MFCSKCGYELTENERYCPKCGNQIRCNTKATEPNKRFSKRGKIFLVIIIFLLVSASCGGIYWGVTIQKANKFYAVVCDGEKYGFINMRGKEVIPFQYDRASDFQYNGKAVVGMITGKYEDGSDKMSYGLIDVDGNRLTDFKYFDIEDFQDNGLARVSIDLGTEEGGAKNGYIDEEGNEVIECKYDSVGEFTSNGITWAKTEEGVFYLNEAGEKIFETFFEDGGDFGENGLAPVKQSGKWGYIDETGNVIIPFQYEEAMEFGTDNLAAVEQDGKWGFINESGEIVIPFQYDGVSGTFSYGTAVVYEGEFIGNYTYALIDIQGNFISNGYEYESIVPLNETQNKKLIEVCKNGRWGFIDVESGEEILPIEYQHIDDFYKNQEGDMSAVGYLEATDAEGYTNLGKPELIDENGAVVFPYEDYIDLLWHRSKYTEEDIAFYGFLEPYGDNGWAVCGDGDIALWFNEEGKIQLDLEGYTEAGKFIRVK